MGTKEIKSGHKKHGGKVFVFKFDDEDADLFERARVHSSGYAVDNRERRIHRLIAKRISLGDLHVDHVNGDRGDNRRANLRSASPSLNARNRSYLGYHERNGKFESMRVKVCKPYRLLTPTVPVNAFARDMMELKGKWPGLKVLVERNRRRGHRLYVVPARQRVFCTAEDAIAYYERCCVRIFGSNEGRRK